MTSLLPQHYEALKESVLIASGFNAINPCDCKVISNQIFVQTKFSISETTLKRIYGFAYSRFKPSLFTIDVMAKYCGYRGWEDFCQKQDTAVVKHPYNALYTWDNLKLNAGKITNSTLQVLRNKSGIPYDQTIKREFLNDHFNEFLNGDYTATVIAAPAGYGKTIGLCHWVEERIRLNTHGETNDAILFFSTSALMNVFLSSRDLNHWLLALLGYSPYEDVSALANTRDKKGGNFFLIIDDFDEYLYKPEQFKLLLNQLIDIFALYQAAPWFKLILTMRSATWINNKHELDNGNNKWLKSFIHNDSWATNTPLFSIQEIKELCLNINPAVKNLITADMANKLNHPLYFQFYYKKHKDDFSLNDLDHVCAYELISTFILNKVYLGQHSAEKILLLRGLVEQMDFGNGKFEVIKTNINGLIKQYAAAYNELISIGFIRELNNSTDLHYNTYIQFPNNDFLEYTIAKTLLHKNNFVFDAVLIQELNSQFANSTRKLPILKWCIIYTIKTGQQKSFEVLSQLQLSLNEKSDLIIFIGDLLQKEYASADNPEELIQYFKQDCSPQLFKYFFGLEFINVVYNKTLDSLLKFGLSNRKRIMVYTALACSAIMRLDVADMALYIDKLSKIPAEDYNRFAINPLKCINALYAYFTHNEISSEVFEDLTKFYFNPPVEGKYFEDHASNDLIYLLGAYTLLLTKKYQKTLRFVNTLEKHYKTSDLNDINGYTFFINAIIAECNYRLGNADEVAYIYNSFSASYKKNAAAFTGNMKNVFFALRIKHNLQLKKYTHIIEDTKTHLQVAGEQRLSKVILLSLILGDQNIAALYPQFYKQCQYDHNKLLRECGLQTNLVFSNVLVQNN
ncbi:hypothetical protein ACFQZI_11940 [Mucilaginibacter lutimaris]|uniref:NACHT domain-containing protein n=1 Tax=Mucilaginibacter lutimaris TaxID=931629 RepID=A0ABW2ZHI5_9SPHI